MTVTVGPVVSSQQPLAPSFLVDEFTIDSLDPADSRRRMPYARDPLRAPLDALGV